MRELLDKIKNFFKIQHLSDNGFDAKEAYLRTYYARDSYDVTDRTFTKLIDEIKDDFSRIKMFEKDIYDLIIMKFTRSEYHCTKDVPDDLVPWIPNIIGDLKNQSYDVVDLYGVVKGLNHHVLFIQWDYDFSKDYNK